MKCMFLFVPAMSNSQDEQIDSKQEDFLDQTMMASKRSADGRYPCPECDKTFTQVGNMRRHLQLHYGKKPWTCQFCGKMFSRKSHVQVHMLSLHKTEVEAELELGDS